jgi:hypothetical protein
LRLHVGYLLTLAEEFTQTLPVVAVFSELSAFFALMVCAARLASANKATALAE